MVRHDNVHRIEWPLGVITAIYPDEKGVIRTAEVEECGRRSLRPVSYLVPLELDCHHEDNELRQCLRENQRNEEEEEDDDDDNDAAAFTMDVDSISEAEDQGSPIVSADAQGGTFPLDVSSSGGQHCIIVRRAAPERAAWPPAPQLGATSTQLLPSPPHRLSHHT